MRTPQQARDWMRNRAIWGTYYRPGTCLIVCRSSYGIDSKYLSAAKSWAAADHKHLNNRAPVGYPGYWTGGERGFGHIAISDGPGYWWSTDILRSGRINRVSTATITNTWNLRYVGWAEEINDVRVGNPYAVPTLPVPRPPAPAPAPVIASPALQEEDIMLYIDVYTKIPATGPPALADKVGTFYEGTTGFHPVGGRATGYAWTVSPGAAMGTKASGIARLALSVEAARKWGIPV